MKLLDYEKQHLSRVRAGLSECMVLLRKNGAFPLDKAEAIAAAAGEMRPPLSR